VTGPLDLADPRCFQGVMPASIATCAADGTPNVTYLSQVHYVDPGHVALSCQFFNKTKQNVLENPYASVQLYDPLTFEAYRLDLHFLHAETEGPLFDAMRVRIDAIASHTGMAGVFRLLSADVYEVLSCEPIEGFLEPPPSEAPHEPELLEGPRNEMRALQRISQCVCGAADLEECLRDVLETLEGALGFDWTMVLLPEPGSDELVTVASRGYAEAGIGARVRVGEGIIGAVAAEHRMLRISSVDEALRYGRAIRASSRGAASAPGSAPEIPLPGLHDAQSQLAIPLLVAGRLLGVLAVESRERLAFDDWDEAFLEIVANQVALAIDAFTRRVGTESVRPASAPGAAPGARSLRFRFYRGDDCVFFDDAYLIRNVPGRVLWKLLRAYADEGRTDFSNRELRLDASLGLPPIRDNLESRLVLLRKRLDERCPGLRLVSTGRGTFRLEADAPLQLEEADSASG